MSQHLTIQRQHFLMFDRIEHPLRKLDLDFLHSTISRFLNDFAAIPGHRIGGRRRLPIMT